MRWIVLTILACSLTGLLTKQAKPDTGELVPDFEKADLVYVLKQIAKSGNRNVFIAPDVLGTVSWHETSPIAWSGAMTRVLEGRGYDWKELTDSRTLVVAKSDSLNEVVSRFEGRKIGCCIYGPDTVRRECVLQRADPRLVVESLQDRYLTVKFVPLPGKNGFYAIGPKKDVEALQAELPNLDVPPRP